MYMYTLDICVCVSIVQYPPGCVQLHLHGGATHQARWTKGKVGRQWSVAECPNFFHQQYRYQNTKNGKRWTIRSFFCTCLWYKVLQSCFFFGVVSGEKKKSLFKCWKWKPIEACQYTISIQVAKLSPKDTLPKASKANIALENMPSHKEISSFNHCLSGEDVNFPGRAHPCLTIHEGYQAAIKAINTSAMSWPVQLGEINHRSCNSKLFTVALWDKRCELSSSPFGFTGWGCAPRFVVQDG